MPLWLTATTLALAAAVLLALLAFALGAWRERERRAAGRSLVLAVLLPLFILTPVLLDPPLSVWLAGALLAGASLLLLAVLVPLGRLPADDDTPHGRIDERDIMFARWRLLPGSPEYTDYYSRHPEKKELDDRIRAAPGLFGRESRLYHPLAMPAADASFAAIDHLQTAVEGPVAAEPVAVDPAEMSRFLKGLACHYGASSAGVTQLADYHVYSHVGRGPGGYGTELAVEHRYALAFSVAMDPQMMRSAPRPAESLEVTKQYLNAAAIAVQLALFIRSLGYPARAHIDGNYRVVCPLVARDAGLGEIGRMGLLMTPEHGPRVRLAVVTTDLPLQPDRPRHDRSVIAFCAICEKCASNCPSRSIPRGGRRVIDGVLRWQINSESCFHYWNVIGTDCGRCISVCPYAHPPSAGHNLVRWAIRRLGTARRLALWLDDFFYGRRPAALAEPDWLRGE